MSEYRKLPVVGAAISDDEWPEIEDMALTIESCGTTVIKILKFLQGSTKFIAAIKPECTKEDVIKTLKEKGYKLLSPYTSKGSIVGYKVVYDPEEVTNGS